ncbi:MAG: hypothetical protein GF330_12970 [Candidatus Eisenbacteria bacterium]|nr:hypothetical protein [Candidatus Eisenbacteria bacterium]
MYRINLYPEYEEKQQRARQRSLRLALLAALVVGELALAGVLAISGALLTDRAGALRERVARLEQFAERTPQQEADLGAVRELLRRRLQRVDWSPKLAALAEHAREPLRLTGLSGEVSRKHERQLLQIEGGYRGDAGAAEPILRLTGALERDSRLGSDFPSVRLETIDWSGPGRFQIVCEGEAGS